MSDPAVAVRGLTRRFGANVAVDGVDVDVAPGELFGFIGPDGAGKTTLFRMLATLLLPDAGSARVLGHDVVQDVWAIRSRVGYMPGRFSLYPDLTVEENLRFFASIFGTTVTAQYDVIAPIYAQIEPFRRRRAGALSGGMKQKLALSCALIHRPRLLLLDEPTTGVDAVSRREFWDLLADLRAAGLTIVVSTPYMDEAGRCDRVALIQGGRLLEVATPSVIGEDYALPLFAVQGPDLYGMLLALRVHPHAEVVYPFGAELHYTDRRDDAGDARIAADVQAHLAAAGFVDGVTVSRIRAGIEDSFMARMGGPPGIAPAAAGGPS